MIRAIYNSGSSGPVGDCECLCDGGGSFDPPTTTGGVSLKMSATRVLVYRRAQVHGIRWLATTARPLAPVEPWTRCTRLGRRPAVRETRLTRVLVDSLRVMKQQFNYFIRRVSNTAPTPMTTLRRRGHPLKLGGVNSSINLLNFQITSVGNQIGGALQLCPVLRRRRRAPRPCRAIPPRRRGVTGPCPRTRSRAVAPRRAISSADRVQ
jgi:hypothetical protein